MKLAKCPYCGYDYDLGHSCPDLERARFCKMKHLPDELREVDNSMNKVVLPALDIRLVRDLSLMINRTRKYPNGELCPDDLDRAILTGYAEAQHIFPIKMIIFCTHCRMQHIDRGEWVIRLHKTHLCEHCHKEFRISDVYTIGVQELTK